MCNSIEGEFIIVATKKSSHDYGMSVYINEHLKAFVGDKRNVTQLLTHLENFATQLYGRAVTLDELLAQPNALTEKLNTQIRGRIQDEYAAYTAKLLRQTHIAGKSALPLTKEQPTAANEDECSGETKSDEAVKPTAGKTNQSAETVSDNPTPIALTNPYEDKPDKEDDDNSSQLAADSFTGKQNKPGQETTIVEVDGDHPLDQYFRKSN